jgi:hypothetical protein
VAAAIPGRTNDQCRERWTEYLSNASAKITWTEEEDKILLDSVKERGNQWKVISLKIGNNKTGQNVSLESLCSLRALTKFIIFSVECVMINLKK